MVIVAQNNYEIKFEELHMMKPVPDDQAHLT